MSLTLSSSVTLISAPYFNSNLTISVCPSIQVITSGVSYIIIIINKKKKTLTKAKEKHKEHKEK